MKREPNQSIAQSCQLRQCYISILQHLDELCFGTCFSSVLGRLTKPVPARKKKQQKKKHERTMERKTHQPNVKISKV